MLRFANTCSRSNASGWGKRHQRRSRQGVSAIDVAVCLPVVMLLVFGAIESSNHLFLKQSLSVACYEGACEASRANATEQQAVACAQKILDSRRVNGFEIRFPEGVSEIDRGMPIICEVSAPTGENRPLAGDFVSNRILTTRVVMLKE